MSTTNNTGSKEKKVDVKSPNFLLAIKRSQSNKCMSCGKDLSDEELKYNITLKAADKEDPSVIYFIKFCSVKCFES